MSALLDSRECHLLIGRVEVLRSGRNPNLDRVYGITLRCIPLAMDDAAAGRHRLDFVGPQNVALTCTVSVPQAAIEHVSDDLHVPVSVWSESFAWSDTIIIQNPQHAKIRIGGIVIVAKRERIKSLEPVAICFSPILTMTNGDHFQASLSAAKLSPHDPGPFDQCPQLHLGDHARQRFHAAIRAQVDARSEEHTSELQSPD